LEIKTGSAILGKRITKYSRLLEIEAELGKAALFINCVGIAGRLYASANRAPRDWSAPRLLRAIEGRQEPLSANGTRAKTRNDRFGSTVAPHVQVQWNQLERRSRRITARG
jgi:hypothetical protein